MRLVALDSQSAVSQKGDYCEARARSVASALAADPDRPTAAFIHHPPFEVEGDPLSFQYETREAFARVASTLASGARVIRLFRGHAHHERQADVGGMLASTVSSIAVDLRQGKDPDRHTAPPRFQVHRYEPLRGFTTQTVDAA